MGSGLVYQNRFKAFAVAADEHLLTVLRYVERNPLRAWLVRRAEDWRWSSRWCHVHGDEQPRVGLCHVESAGGRTGPSEQRDPVLLEQ